MWVPGGGGPPRSRPLGALPPGLEPVGSGMLGSGTVEEAVVWQDSTQTYRLQLNPKIMLIESKYTSQLHFSDVGICPTHFSDIGICSTIAYCI